MGLFLQTAIIPDCKEEEIRKAVEKLAARSMSDIDPAQCQYKESEAGCAVLFNDDCCGYEELAKKLSAALPHPVLLLYIYDGDFWGYFLYENKKEVDCFNSLPDYFDCSPEEQQQCAGDSAVIARYFHVEKEDIQRYLRFWTGDMMERYDEPAYPGDEFGQCNCWQMADFMGKLGFPYTFGEEEA